MWNWGKIEKMEMAIISVSAVISDGKDISCVSGEDIKREGVA